MNTRRSVFLQSIRGPVLLITLGVLFAIHQAGILSFSRTWPLLIIVIGIMKLLERSSGPVPALPASTREEGDISRMAPILPLRPTRLRSNHRLRIRRQLPPEAT